MNPCAHFGTCGGCSLQNLSPEDYHRRKRDQVFGALVRAGLDGIEVEKPLAVQPRTRRRAVFRFGKEKGRVIAGFHAAKSHAIVDMRECLVLRPALLAFTDTLRQILTAVLREGEKAEVHVTETETGLDLAFRWPRKLTPELTALLAQAFAGSAVARIVFNGEMVAEDHAPQIVLGGVTAVPPPHAFLQASKEGEAALQARVLALTEGAKHVVDLFTGLGTFALPLSRRAKVHAVESDPQALAALATAARKSKGLKPLTIEPRDLFKLPLTPLELNPFDAAVLDPPRAGAEAQAKALATSKVGRIAYVSCNPASFARDAAILVKGGFRPGTVTPVDQFLYSDHIELVAGFAR